MVIGNDDPRRSLRHMGILELHLRLTLSGLSAQFCEGDAPLYSELLASSATLTPFATNTMLIAPAHAGSASRRSAPSMVRTTWTILWEISSAHFRGSALTSKPSPLPL